MQYPNRPTFAELLRRIGVDLDTVPAHVRDGLSASWARAVDGLHDHIAWAARQSNPLDCDEDMLPLWAWLYGVDRLQAVAATGTAAASGNAQSPILEGTLLRGPGGLDYALTHASTLDAQGNATVSLRCASAGASGNLTAGTTLNLIDPVAGVATRMTVGVDGISGGAELETVDAWRSRVTGEWREITTNGARGGKPADYACWCRAAHPDVSTALVQRHTLGWGTVIVRPVCNNLSNRAPSTAVLAACDAKLLAVAPATADWRLTSPLPRNVLVRIDLAAAADNAGKRAAIAADIAALVLAESGSDAVLKLAEIDAAIAQTTTDYIRLLPSADIAVAAGEVLVLQTLEWV